MGDERYLRDAMLEVCRRGQQVIDNFGVDGDFSVVQVVVIPSEERRSAIERWNETMYLWLTKTKSFNIPVVR